MKKLITILFLIIFITGCTPLQAEVEPEIIIETVVETVIVTVEDTDRIEQLEAEIRQYRDLIANLDSLLSNVYYGYASNNNWILDGFTAFSIKYKGRFYLITAGHCVENEYGKFTYFKFKTNSSSEWIYPELLSYNNDYNNKVDYAIFTSDKISDGLNVDLDDDKPIFIIGRNKTISDCKKITIEGESGSPILDIEGEITRVVITDTYAYSTNINVILKAIDSLN